MWKRHILSDKIRSWDWTCSFERYFLSWKAYKILRIKVYENNLSEKIKNLCELYENITGIRIEKDLNEKDVFIVHAFEGFNLLNDLKSCDFSVKLKNGKFYIVNMNPIFNPKPYEDEINQENGELKNLGNMIGKIIINEFPQYVITWIFYS